MAIENVVIAYLADISDIKRSVTQISAINKQLAQKMGVDFSKGFSVISSELKKVQFDKQFKIKITGEKGFKKVRGTISTFEKTVRSADGQLFKFTETIGKSAKGSVVLASSINKVVQAQGKLTGVSSKLATRFNDLKNVNATFSKQLGSFGQVSRLVGTSLNQLSDNGSKVSKIFETTNGKFVQLTQTTKKLPNGVQQVTRSIKQLSKTQSENARVLERSNTSTKSFAQNLKRLAGRALLTIPVWFALRRSIQLVFTTIKDGLTAIIDFDRALQKAKRNLQGSAQSIEKNFLILRKEVTKLSLETGRSVEDITQAFQKFATVGFDFETSLAGANSATKLSILLFGDAQETANAFARAMRVLIDESKDAKPASEQLAEAMALTAELWETNAFELNELTASLERFSPVAKTAGFSANEAVKLMAGLSTAGLRGSKAGRLLSTSLVRLVTKTDELAKSLGIKVNPEMDRTFDIFLRVLDALQKTRSEAGKVSPEFEKIVKSIFGLRSGLAVKGLIALRENLQKVLETSGDLKKFNKDFEEVNKTVFQLVAQFRNLNKEMGKAFITGLVGGEDFRDSLEEIVEFQNKIIKNSQAIGKALTISGQITFGSTTFLENEISKSIEKIFKIAILKGVDILEQEVFDKINKGLLGKLNKIELKELIIEIRDDKIKLPNDLKQSIEATLRAELSDILAEVTPTVVLDKIEISLENQQKLIKALIKDQLERAKLAGATESQLLKIEDRLIRQSDINDNIISQKIRQLEIDRKITEEQKARVQFSDESAKLAKIAKDEGIGTARAISEVLSGQRDFNIFLRQGGKRAEILKDQFADFVKNQELLKFFLGRGAGIDIQERLGQRDFTPIRGQAQFELAKARIGLKESTNKNKTAIEQNTISIKNLISNFQQGLPITNLENIQRLVDFFTTNPLVLNPQPQLPLITPTGAIPTTRSVLDITVNVDGTDLRFQGTPESIRQLASQVSQEVAKAIEEKLVNDIKNNPQSPSAQAVDQRINEF